MSGVLPSSIGLLPTRKGLLPGRGCGGDGCSADFESVKIAEPCTWQFHGPPADSWLWDFGDGETSTLQHPIHEYVVNYALVTLTIEIGSKTCSSDGQIDCCGLCLPAPFPVKGLMVLSDLAECYSYYNFGPCQGELKPFPCGLCGDGQTNHLTEFEGAWSLVGNDCTSLNWRHEEPSDPLIPEQCHPGFELFYLDAGYDTNTGRWTLSATLFGVLNGPSDLIHRTIAGPNPCLGPGIISSDDPSAVDVNTPRECTGTDGTITFAWE